ncbi:MAG TPA: NUDIX domain-containing protein [Clostridiales bacterium]|nr:NUDIX domain-containing protein [Clostridiales bacterium]HQP70393.1 NUDIX domain-containing protein [Clostridiales bacterium]
MNCDNYTTILNCAERELFEEISLRIDKNRLKFIGIINDDKTEVGSVHFGAVFLYKLDDIEKIKNTTEIESYQWLSMKEIDGTDNLEEWSRIAMILYKDFFLK